MRTLPREVRERFVGLGHAVRRFFLGDSDALAFMSSLYLIRKLLRDRINNYITK